MNMIYTDGNNKDFNLLCGMLDDYLNEIVGGKKQRENYNQYNTLENIHDVVLLYDNDTPIACASYKHYDEGIAEMKRVFLKKEYRGRGLSKDLIRQLEANAKEKGYHTLILETGLPLNEACHLYQSMGYQRIANYGPYCCMKDSICMSKNLY